jgi:hypothetical protein
MDTRYQRGNQNLQIEEGQTTQWSQDTKGVIRIYKLKRDKQHNGKKILMG